MRGLTPGGAQGLLGLPSTHLTHEGAGAQSMSIPPGPAAVKDDWETAIEEAVEEWKGAGAGRPEEPEGIDISGGNGIIGTGVRGEEILRAMERQSRSGNEPLYQQVNIHGGRGGRNTELDEVDLDAQIIYEDKSARSLYMYNPNVPQTEQQWAGKQIYDKTENRILALQQMEFRMSSQVALQLPDIQGVKKIQTFVFRIDKDTPALRKAVHDAIGRLNKKFPGYEFYAVFGGE